MEEQLILAVESHKNIYDKNRKDFKDNRLKEESWRAIASSLGISVGHCQTRWKSLRERYVKEKHAELTRTNGDNSGNTRPWPFMELMRFLDNYVRHRKRFGSLPTSLEKVSKVEMICEVSPNIEIFGTTPFPIMHNSSDSQSRPSSLTSSPISSPSTPQFPTPCSPSQGNHSTPNMCGVQTLPNDRRKRPIPRTDFDSFECSVLKTMTLIMENLTQTHKSEDQLFGETIGAMLSNLEVKKNKKMKMNIMKLFCEMEDE